MKSTSLHRLLLISALLVISGVLAGNAFSQPSSVDLSFAPVPSLAFGSVDVSGKGIVAQPDGKVIIWGGNLVVDGTAGGEVARLNIDGRLDNSFNYCGCLLANLNNVAVQTDGKILLAGSFNSHAKVVRLNLDGSQDASFVSSFTNDGSASASGARINQVQPDGKILVELSQGFQLGYHSGVVFRLNPDGSADTGFTVISYDGGRNSFGTLVALVLDSSGRIYIAITGFSGPSAPTSVIRRHNPDGTQDSNWGQPSFTRSDGLPPRIYGLAVQPDGALLISGRFESVNGLPKRDLVRILPAQNVDMAFTAPTLGTGIGQLALLPAGKILVGYNVTGDGLIARLNADGSADPTFMLSPTVQAVFDKFVLDPMGRILFFGLSDSGKYMYFRLNPNGDTDSTFSPSVTKPGTVRSLALQGDGKIIVAGNFIQLNGVSRISIARINGNGAVDTSFDGGSGFDQPPARMVLQSDGTIIVAGEFTEYNGSSFPGLARLNANGSIDSAFGPEITGSVNTASVQADGRILIGGNFTSVNSTPRTGVARLNANGVLDEVFNPIIGNPSISEIFQQPDGRIMIGGSFSGVNGFNRSAMVRLNDNGSLDQTFDATGVGSVSRIYLQADGKYVVTGGFSIRRRTSTGGADNTFVPPTFTAGSIGTLFDAVIIQPDGTMIVAGSFVSNPGNRPNLIRLTSDGTLDQLFFQNGTDGPVRAAVRQSDGKIVIGGNFAKVNTIPRAGLARLIISAFHVATPFDFNGDGRADISVVRPSTNRWYEALSSTGTVYEESFGLAGDIPVPADFDGDGITDEAIYRPSAANAQWWYRSSVNGGLVLNQFGGANDIPRPADFDGDGKADLVLFRPGDNTWYRYSSLTRQASSTPFGAPGDQPLVGDFDGDGKDDLVVFRPSTGDWWYAATSAGGSFRQVHWGQNGDIPVPADYDGDGKTDHAVFRPSDGGWYIYNSGNGSFTILAFGTLGDRPVAADYDGDGRADIAVFRPSTGIWYLYQTTSGFAGYQFGISTDTAIPGSLIP